MFRVLSGALCVLCAISPLFNEAEAQLNEHPRDPMVVDGDGNSSSSGVELGCQTRPTKEEITNVIDNLRRRLRGLGDLDLKPLWDEHFKKYLEGIGAKDLPSAVTILCPLFRDLKKDVEAIERALDTHFGAPDYYYNPDPFFGKPDEATGERNGGLRRLLQDLRQALESSRESDDPILQAIDDALGLLKRLQELFEICGPPSPSDSELIKELVENFKKLVEDLILRPKNTVNVRNPANSYLCIAPNLDNEMIM